MQHRSVFLTCASARDGDLDRGFGTGGKLFAKYSFWFVDAFNIELAQQPDGKLLLAASRDFANPDYDFGVMRLMPDGSTDTTFGTNGERFVVFDRTDSDNGDHGVGMTLQSDGKIVLVGIVDGDPATGDDMGITRLNSDGSLDTAFGTSGKTIVPFNLGDCANQGCTDVGLRVNLQADSKILLIGSATSNPDSSTQSASMAIARLTSSGQRDSTFDVDGRVTLQFGTGADAFGFRAKQLADGTHILAMGNATTTPEGTNRDFALARLNDNGSLDVTFGVGGKTTYGFDIGGDLDDRATDFVELPDGKLMVCGEARANSPFNYDFACMRFLANGVPDPAFSPVLIPFDIGGGFQDAPLRLERDSRGRFLLIGFAERTTNSVDFAVARLMPEGALDTSFGNGGTMTYDSNPGTTGGEQANGASGLVVQPDGKIVIAGYADSDGTGKPEFEVIRVIGDTIFENGFDG